MKASAQGPVARKLWQLGWQDRLLLARALVWLGIARLIIAVLPFRRIVWLTSRGHRRERVGDVRRRTLAGRVGWAVCAAAARVPWRALCFEQSLAAHFILRRLGVETVLHFGAAPDDKRGLMAHVWLCAGPIEVVGGETASWFAELEVQPRQAGNAR